MQISIIIPTYNEADNIHILIKHLLENSSDVSEIIIADGGSNDKTLDVAIQAGAIAVTSPKKGRAAQMNYGASLATGDIFYFIHADTVPPTSYASDIITSVEKGYVCGRYRTRFNSKSWILKMNAFFTRFDLFVCYGGDQTFFITRELFDSINGFNEDLHIMEDYDNVSRARKHGKYKIIGKDATISARKYETNSWLKVQIANYTIVQMYKKGAGQQEMVNKYKTMLDYR